MTTFYTPTAIDLSRLPAPQAIEALSTARLLQDFVERFLVFWDEQRAVDPTLPAFDEQGLQTNPAIVAGRAWTYLRLLDRQRVNDGFRALLAPLATGANLEAIAASRNVARLVVQPATAITPAIMQTDASLLRDYLLSFDKASAGSRDRYLYEAFRAWPTGEGAPGLLDARVNGFNVHGRRGDTDIVIIGPGGRLPTEEERLMVRDAVSAPHVKKDAVSVSVLPATRLEYTASMVIELPPGPDPALVTAEAVARVRKAGDERMLIGGEVSPGYLIAAAYGPNVIRVINLDLPTINGEPYTVPVLTDINITAEVRT